MKLEWLVLLGIAALIWLCLRIIDRLSDLDSKVENLWSKVSRNLDKD